MNKSNIHEYRMFVAELTARIRNHEANNSANPADWKKIAQQIVNEELQNNWGALEIENLAKELREAFPGDPSVLHTIWLERAVLKKSLSGRILNV